MSDPSKDRAALLFEDDTERITTDDPMAPRSDPGDRANNSTGGDATEVVEEDEVVDEEDLRGKFEWLQYYRRCTIFLRFP